MNNFVPILNFIYVFFVPFLYCKPITHTTMKSKRIFTSEESFTLCFITFLEDHQSLDDFLYRTEFMSIASYCSYFYARVCDGDCKFRDAVCFGFAWKSDEFRRWHLLSQEWIKFIYSK